MQHTMIWKKRSIKLSVKSQYFCAAMQHHHRYLNSVVCRVYEVSTPRNYFSAGSLSAHKRMLDT